ncbi:MAG: hypothetical protein JST83_00805 [Bacteroidetes bacterium]|nr:hypothetical protein [Bacteroidota bacterium]
MKPINRLIIGFELLASLIAFAQCSSPDAASQSKIEQDRTMAYYKDMLEQYPYNVHFELPHEKFGKVDDSTFFTNGSNADRSLQATIRYNPRDQEVYWIDLQLSKLPLDPSQADVQILLDFTNKIDPSFSDYFWRNRDGIFKDENMFIDTSVTDGKWCRFYNKKKGYIFYIDGDVNLNNCDLKNHPELKEQILAAGNFVSITVKNNRRGMPTWSSECLIEK